MKPLDDVIIPLMRSKLVIASMGIIVLTSILGFVLLKVPTIQERVGWRLSYLSTRVKYLFNPPQQVIFIPEQQSVQSPAAIINSTPTPTMTTVVEIAFGTPTMPSVAALSPTPTSTREPTSTSIPLQVTLTGVNHEFQKYNNCGPANLSMLLSYWGWTGNQSDTAAYLRPEPRDKNVNPSEMVRFVLEKSDLDALVRVGGDVSLLKQLIAAGYPVMIEKGHDPIDDWWMGHYLVMSGYDDEKASFITQDSLIMPDLKLPYEKLIGEWRDFNNLFLIIFPPEHQQIVRNLLGVLWYEEKSYQVAYQKAETEIELLTGRDLFFAWYNLGSNLVGLQKYARAADAYDHAFGQYQKLSEEDRPYRMLWYQVGPYPAYYYSGRYQDVISLANTTFAWVGEPVLEETYYWRGMARLAQGETEKAISDFQKAVKLNPNSTEALAQLALLGVVTP